MVNSASSLQEIVCACCQSGDSAAWEEFVRRSHHLIAGAVLRTARRWSDPIPAQVDDLVQETYLKLYVIRDRMEAGMEGRTEPEIYGYLKSVTINVVHDHFKALHSEKRGGATETGDVTEKDAPIPHRATGHQDSVERAILLDEMDRCLQALCPQSTVERDRNIFWLYYRHGMTAGEIAALSGIGLTIKGVESAIHRLTQLVKRCMVEGRASSPPEAGPLNEKGFEPAESL